MSDKFLSENKFDYFVSIFFEKLKSIFAKKDELNSHEGNADVHTTADEKASWNNASSAAHTHSNKTVLDKITETNYNDWQSAKNKAHVHDNIDILDGIDSNDVLKWETAYADSHTHDNKDVLDKITEANYNDWQSSKNKAHVHDNIDVLNEIGSNDLLKWEWAYTESHTHNNKDVLDGITGIDASPTKNSTNLVTSNGIYKAIARSRANITVVNVDVSIEPGMWQDGAVGITNKEIHTDSVVMVGLQMGTATAELAQAVGNAIIVALAQEEGRIILECLGTIPDVVIPLTLTIITDTSYAVIQTIDFTVLPSDWVDGVVTLTDANFFADSIVDIGLQVGAATADIAKAAANATIAAQSQTDGAITLVCFGTVPSIALPLSVTVINVGG